ncbi:MAG: lipocalin family protein [Tidjanibacter sp.]|nr:lipocalin family protein [Tidjanibacter sp.]
MKKSIFGLILAAFVSLFALSSCEPEPADMLVGTWKLTAMNISANGMSMDIDPKVAGIDYTYSFGNNGTATLVISNSQASSEISTVTYTVTESEGKSIITFTTTDGDVSTVEMIHLDATRLVLKVHEFNGDTNAVVTLTFARF